MGKFTDHTGETNIAKNGLKMTIIAYRGCNDMDIQFENGIIVHNKRYINFKKGKIKHPNINALCNKNKIKYIGETNIAKNGLKMEIIEYYNNRNITIKFEDGVIAYNKQYGDFRKGLIKHPNINTQHVKNTTNYIGETNIATNGMEMTIIEYRRSDNIDVKFEDGKIVHNKTYAAFKNGNIAHPDIHTTKKKNRIGETNIANNGLKMTIIEYYTASDITIKFEDNTIVYNKTYEQFKKGRIEHPTIKTKHKIKINRINETRIMKCGLKAAIIKYHNANNINVQFENNIIIYGKRYDDFKKGRIKMPDIINTIKLKEFAYKFNDNWYYICSHPTWTEDKILSVKEIYAYQLN